MFEKSLCGHRKCAIVIDMTSESTSDGMWSGFGD